MDHFLDWQTGIKFKKTGREIRAAIAARVDELRDRLARRDKELESVMTDRTLLRSYLVREPQNDFPHSAQARSELPSEDHQRITELCRRIRGIEREIANLSVVRDNLTDDQDMELSFHDVLKLGFSPEHFPRASPGP